MIIGTNMHPKIIIDIDIQEDGKRAKNMMNQIKEIIDDHQGDYFDRCLFDSIVEKIEKKQQYFSNYNFPPMFCLVTVYGVALVDKEERQVMLAQQAIMSPEYRITEEQKKRGSIL